MGTMCWLTNPIQNDINSIWIQENKFGDKVYPPLPYFHIQLKAYCLPGISLLRSVTSIQKQHQHPEYLRGHMVDLSSIVLLDSAKVGFPKQFGANGHWWVRWPLSMQLQQFSLVEAWILLYDGGGTKPKKSLWVWLISLKGCCLCSLYPTCRALRCHIAS
jgi:hypothetical protein